MLPTNWQTPAEQQPPYTSTIVFLVRKGNPKGIKDWGDLVKPGVAVITPNPKTSGGARWNYLAAWAGPQAARRQRCNGRGLSSRKLYKNVPVLDTGARGSTTTFVQRGIGDVLIAWENEAFLAIKELGAGQVRDRGASISILAEPPVAVVDGVTPRHRDGRRGLPRSTCTSPEAQEIVAKNYYRPRNTAIAGEVRQIVPQDEDGDHRRFRRLDEGAGKAFRRRRRVRPHLCAADLRSKEPMHSHS